MVWANDILWVDSLCIVQDSQWDKGRQIKLMASIYRNAALTIIAAGTQESGLGLSGVNPLAPRKKCAIVRRGSTALITTAEKSLRDTARVDDDWKGCDQY